MDLEFENLPNLMGELNPSNRPPPERQLPGNISIVEIVPEDIFLYGQEGVNLRSEFIELALNLFIHLALDYPRTFILPGVFLKDDFKASSWQIDPSIKETLHKVYIVIHGGDLKEGHYVLFEINIRYNTINSFEYASPQDRTTYDERKKEANQVLQWTRLGTKVTNDRSQVLPKETFYFREHVFREGEANCGPVVICKLYDRLCHGNKIEPKWIQGSEALSTRYKTFWLLCKGLSTHRQTIHVDEEESTWPVRKKIAFSLYDLSIVWFKRHFVPDNAGDAKVAFTCQCLNDPEDWMFLRTCCLTAQHTRCLCYDLRPNTSHAFGNKLNCYACFQEFTTVVLNFKGEYKRVYDIPRGNVQQSRIDVSNQRAALVRQWIAEKIVDPGEDGIQVSFSEISN
jgi:hypothetical protein